MCNFWLNFFGKNYSAASLWRPAAASNCPQIGVLSSWSGAKVVRKKIKKTSF